jgi:ELWxxDGT repeat protein
VSSVDNLTDINGVLYFSGNGNNTGTELWKLDPTTGTTSVIDIVAGSGSSSPDNFISVNGTLFFTASNSSNGNELWKLNNTGNPVLVKDIRTGNSSSSPSNLFNVNGTLYFTANDGTNGTELWRSDGTAAGTVQLEIYTGANSSNIANLTNAGGTLYFTANNATSGTELWRINSTTGNPELLEINTGGSSSSPSNLTLVNETLYFQASDNTNGDELWKVASNGTPTRIDLGSGSSSPRNLININGTLYFTAQGYNGVNYLGQELWKIDPTTGNPNVIDIVSGSGSSSPNNLTNVNGVLYFTAVASNNGRELWKLDPNTGNPVFLEDIQTGSGSSSIDKLTYSNGKLYFTADNGTQGVELWAVDVNSINTVGTVSKSGNEDTTITFTANDFASVFDSSGGTSLAKIQVIQLPSNGILKLGNNSVTANQEIAVADLGNLRFVPDANYNGTAGFTWNGSDGTTYATNPSNVIFNIASVNDSPELVNPIPNTNFFNNSPSSFTISPNAFRDVDLGDSLTYTATLADGSPLPSWLTLNDRTFNGTPPVTSAGQFEIKVTAKDSNNTTATDTFTLNVINSAPNFIDLSNNIIPENSADNTFVGTLSTRDNNSNDTHTYTLVNDADGRFVLDGNKLIVANGGLLDYETATNHTIRVKTTDNTGLSYERDINIVVSNVNDSLAGVLSFTATTYRVNEDGTNVVAVTVQRTGGSEGFVRANVLLSNGSATFPDDYNGVSIPVNFANGETSKTVTIPIVDDTVNEGNETINLTLANPQGGATLGTQTTAVLTIIDNDQPKPGTIAFTQSSFSINEDGTPVAIVTITRTGGSDGEVSAEVNLNNGSAIDPNDYDSTAITVNFANGETSKTVTIPIVDDNLIEGNETVNLSLANPTGGAVLGSQKTATLAIVDNDVQLAFASSSFSVNEDGTPINQVTVVRTGLVGTFVSTTIDLNNGTATAPSDYTNTPITVNFEAGETRKTVAIPIVNDTAFEGTETIELTLTNSQGATIGTQSTATLNIIDNDANSGTIAFSAAEYTVNENGIPVSTVTLTRTGGSDGVVSVRVNLNNNTAIAPNDYNNAPITVSFADGETSKTINIPIVNDAIVENTEKIALSLSNPTGGAVIGSQDSAVVNIVDDDVRLNFSAVNYTVNEDGTVVTEILVTRSGRTTGAVSATLSFADGTATGCGCSANSVNNDFHNGTFAVEFADGETSKVIAVENAALGGSNAIRIRNDAKIEGNETFTINLINPTGGATIGSQGSATVTILDDDVLPKLTVTFNPNVIAEDSGNIAATGTVTRDVVTDTPLVVTLSSSDTTEATVPQTVTIEAGQASATFSINAVDDAVVDGTQTVTITATPLNPNTTTPLPEGAGSNTLQVTDNESPSLTLTLDKNIVGETGTATATITRNTDTTEALTVTLFSSDTTEATVPQTVTILAGETSATFTVTGVNDRVSDGSQSVTLTATADGLNNGVQSLEVTDIDIPDLVVTKLEGVQPTFTGKQTQFGYTVTNKGITSASGTWTDKVYLSADNKLDDTDTLLGAFTLGSTGNPANLLAGTSYSRTVSYFAPRIPGQYYLIATTDTGNAVNEGVTIGETNNTTITPLTINPAYRATVYTDTETSIAGTSVILRGQALSNADNSPVPFEFVKVRIENNGTIREFDSFTDANGNFVREFKPLPGEAGTYNINAYFPNFAAEDTAAEDQFTLLGMRFEQNNQFLAQVSQKIVEGTTFSGQVALQNLSNIDLSGLTASIIDAPSNWIVEVTPEKNNLGGNEEIQVNYKITVPDDTVLYDQLQINLTTTEGVTATLPVTVNVEQILPRLVADTSSLQASMLRGGQTLVEFTVTNQGGIASGELDVLFPEASWLKLASPVKIPSLNPGESSKVAVLLQAATDQELAVYNGDLVIAGNEASLRMPFSFRAISEATGNLQINVVDELFFFAEGSPKVENATITLLDPFTGEVVFSETDADGVFSKTGLAEGYYSLQISANNHDTYRQNIFIGAGETEDIQAFISRQTVKYSWTVTPIEIQDKYKISVETIFETDVPIPVVTFDPPLIDLADLQAIGQVMQIDMVATNHGLIAANDIKLNFGEHPFYKIEPLINDIDVLSAKSSLTIPVRITRIADFETLGSQNRSFAAASAPSVPCNISASGEWSFLCGLITVGKSTPIAVNNVDGNCGGIGLPGGSGTFNPIGGGGPSGPFVYSSTPVTVSPCVDSCPCPEFGFSIDASDYFEPIIEGAEAVVNGFLKGRVEVELDVSAEAGFKSCCEEDEDGCGKKIGVEFEAEAEVKAEVEFGPNLSVDFDKDLDLEFSAPLGLIKELEIDGEVSVGITGTPSISITASAESGCNFEDPKFEVKGEIGFEFQAGASGEVDIRAVVLETGSEVEAVINTKGEGKVGLFGNVSYSFGYSSERGFYSCLQSEGLYYTAFVSAFGVEFSLFEDDPATEKDEKKQYLIDEVECDSGEARRSTSRSSLEQSLAGLDAERTLQVLEDILSQKAKTLIEEYKQPSKDKSSVCAKVKIQIDQEAVMTRSAFLGNLEIDNGNLSDLTNISVVLEVKDENGNVVNDLFGVTNPILQNITKVDGTGILAVDDPNTPQDEGVGSAQWTFVPTNLAAIDIPTQYSIGGILSYIEEGKQVTVPLVSAPITVYPQAELYLDYFQQRDVFADDPFTDDVVEPSVPYSLGVLVRNEGKGDAKNLQITSSQPKIVENEKGLLVDFQIIGSEVNGTGVSPSLTVDFGNIAAGETAVADWLLKSSIQGKFIDYKATFEHINSLGIPELSLIKEVTIHELIRKVEVDHENPDNLPDFLVNGQFDANFYPDILYFSNGTTAPVTAVDTATIDAPPTLADLEVDVTVTVDAGWNYIRLAEPSNSQYEIQKVLRADGTEVGLDSVWTTDRTFPATGRPVYENILHFLDENSSAGTTNYTIIYTPGGASVTDIVDVTPDPRSTPVNAITVNFSEAIKGDTFDYRDISLTLNGGTNLVTSDVTVTYLSPTSYQINGLNALTSGDGEYILTVNAAEIQDTSGKVGTGSNSETWLKANTGNADTTSPTVTDIVDLLVNPRNLAVSSLDVTLSESIDLSTFTFEDLSLTRNGSSNLITNAVTISAVNDTTYRINGLTASTTAEGNYTLSLNGSNIQDLSGNNGTGTQSQTWTMDTTVPNAPTNISIADTPIGDDRTRIGTTTPTITGELSEAGLRVSFLDKATNQSLGQAIVTGTIFSSTLNLPASGTREIEIQVRDAAGNITTSTIDLFVDITKPAIDQFPNVPTSTPNPIETIDVRFSEQIDLNTFDLNDLTLTRNGQIVELPDTVTIAYLADTTYRISGLKDATTPSGIYQLKVDATAIQDNAGNSGDAAKTVVFTVESTDVNLAPTLVNLNKSRNEDKIVEFDRSEFTAAFSDADGDSLTKVRIVSLPNNGTLNLNDVAVTQGQEIDFTDLDNLTFTPKANFNGKLSFDWNGFDGETYAANSAKVNIKINAVNDTPTVKNSIAPKVLTENKPFNFTIPNIFGNVDRGDSLTLAATLANGTPLPDWLTFDPSSRTFSSTATDSDVGKYQVKLTATDKGNLFAETSFDLTILNHIRGNNKDNILEGTTDGDRINGLRGNDSIDGKEGDDRLIGHLGNDILTGGAGNDLFIYTRTIEGGDTITDFSLEEDSIALGQLFKNIGYTGENPVIDGYLTWIEGSSADETIVRVDIDGINTDNSWTILTTLSNVNTNSLSLDNFIF